MGDHALQLIAVEFVDQAPGYGDRGILRREARREGIQGRVLHDRDARLGQAGGTAQAHVGRGTLTRSVICRANATIAIMEAMKSSWPISTPRLKLGLTGICAVGRGNPPPYRDSRG